MRTALGTVTALAWAAVRRRPLATALTALSVALGVGLAVGVVCVADSAESSFEHATRGYEVLLAPPNEAPLQAVLVTLFHADVSAATLPWSAYEAARADPKVKAAVPYAVGDVFRGHRIVGTTPLLFDTLRGADGRPLGADLRGRMFDEARAEAVIGSRVAAHAGLRIGDAYHPSHGTEGGGPEHEETWEVVGVLRPTGTPNDAAIFIPIEGFFGIEGHQGDAAKGKELSAVGIHLRVPELLLTWREEVRRSRTDVQAVLPHDEVRKLKVLVGDRDRAFRAMAWLAVGVALLGVLVSLYTATIGRRREIAILRALGARPGHVFSVIVLEALLLCLIGGAAGLLLGHLGAPAAAPGLLRMLGVGDYGVSIDASLRPFDGQVLGALAVLGLLAGLLPAWRGLRTPVARNLQPSD